MGRSVVLSKRYRGSVTKREEWKPGKIGGEKHERVKQRDSEKRRGTWSGRW